MQKVAETADNCLLNNYGKRDVVFTRGIGHYIYDADDNEYLDFTAGIAVNCLGHSDPGWAEAVSKQANMLVHTSNLWLNVEQVALGEKLTRFSFADKAFFCNSGTEANEAAIKFSRKFHVTAEQPREEFVAFENAFHGRTMGALALTYKQAYKEPFQPLMPSTSFVPFNDIAALDAITTKTCAVFVEPMQGEGGCVPGDVDFMKALRQRCDEVGALLVFDEVQCGLGRTGHLFAYQLSGVIPDLMTLAKPLAGGLPIGAVLMSDKVAKCILPGEHGSTFAGAPLVCAAGNYTFDRINQPSFLKNVQEMGTRLRTGLQKMVEPHDLPVRGEGLLVGVVFPDAASCSAVQKAATENGLLVLTAGAGNVLRIAPALTVTSAEVDLALERLQVAFRSAM
jgi:predicted acetylornithine/succinylornithine family transaminase